MAHEVSYAPEDQVQVTVKKPRVAVTLSFFRWMFSTQEGGFEVAP